MIETWRGNAPVNVEERQRQLFDELRLLESHFPSLNIAAAKLDAKESGHQKTINANVGKLVIHMLHDKCAIITCHPGLGRLMLKRGLKSPFGAPHSDPNPPHAIVIMVRDSNIIAFDPWFEADGQPVSLSTREFVEIWRGYMALFER